MRRPHGYLASSLALAAVLLLLMAATGPAAAQTPGDCAGQPALEDFPGNAEILSDCNILLNARDVLEGSPGPNPPLNWSASVKIQQWQGITVSGGRVTRLVLNSTTRLGLDGSIPAELGGLSALTQLSLQQQSGLTGGIPPQLGNLSLLTTLDLSTNGLSGRIPAELGNLTRLTSLNLQNNDLSGPIPAALGSIPGLQRLDLSDNNLQGELPSTLGGGAGVFTFDFRNNGGLHERRDQLYVAYTMTPDTANPTDLFEGGGGSVTVSFVVQLHGMVETLKNNSARQYDELLANQVRLAWFLKGQLIDPMKALTPQQCATTPVPPEGPANLDEDAVPNGLSIDRNDPLSFTLTCQIDTSGMVGEYTGDDQLRFRVEGLALPAHSNALIRPRQLGSAPTLTVKDADVQIDGETIQQLAENLPFRMPLTLLGHYDAAVTWTKAGADEAQFAITNNGGNYFLEMTAKDFETPVDAGTNNTYTVTVTAYTSYEGTTKSASKTFTVTVQDVSHIPRFLEESPVSRSVAENTAAGQPVGGPLTAVRGDIQGSPTLAYSLQGTDAASFAIDSASGQISTNAALDFETKKTWSVEVAVTDGAPDNTADATITVDINVTDVNEPPVISGATAIPMQPERRYVTTYTAADPDRRPDGSSRQDEILWTLAGTDAALFEISGAGDLTFKAAPDFETATQKSFSVTVQVSDQRDPDFDLNTEVDASTNVSITLINSDEPGSVALSRSSGLRVGDTVTAMLTDPDGAPASVTWRWERSPTLDTFDDDGNPLTHADWTAIEGAGAAVYTLAYIDADMHVRALAGYTDPQGPGKSAQSPPTDDPTIDLCAGAAAIAAYRDAGGNDSPGIRADCNALMASKAVLEGSGANKLTLNWSTSTGIAGWDGITVAMSGGEQRVTELVEFDDDTTQPDLTGSLPAVLADLDALTDLDLRSHVLTGAIPAELGNLGDLELLRLDGNNLTGGIPAELGNLSNLTDLRLNENDLDGAIPAALGGLSNLQVLWLSGNRLAGPIPVQLGGLTNLTDLRLNNNNLAGSIPAELGNLSNLTDLRLNNTRLTGAIPAALGSLSNLQRLYLEESDLTGAIPAALGSLSDLRILTLQYNDLTGAIPAELGNLGNLQRLWLHNNDLTGAIPSSLHKLGSLTHLDLSQNCLSGAIPGRFDAGTQLTQSLSLSLIQRDPRGDCPSGLTSEVRLSVQPQTLAEDAQDTTLTFTITVDEGAAWAVSKGRTGTLLIQDLKVRVAASGPQRTPAASLSSPQGTHTVGDIARDQTSFTITVTPENDATEEHDQAYQFRIDSGVGASGVANTTLRDLSDAHTLTDDDQTVPTIISLTRNTDSPTNADTLAWTITFSEEVQNVSADGSDFEVTGVTGATVAVATSDNVTYTVTASGGALPDHDGDVELRLATGQDIQDPFGNALDTDNLPTGDDWQPSYTLDNTAPTVTIATDYTAGGGPFTATFTFSEDLATGGFTLADIQTSNGATASNFRETTPNRVYTATITPTAYREIEISVPAAAAQDPVGNDSEAASSTVTVAGDLGIAGLADANVAENTPYSAAPTQTGTPIGSVTWSKEGADADDFTIDANTGALSMVARNFESPQDADTSNDYEVTVKVTDSVDTTVMGSVDIVITVTDANEAPAFPSATEMRTVAEETAAGTDIGAPLTATDVDGDTLVYSLDAAGDAVFDINASTGQISTSAALDHEDTPSYTVTVTATDAGGLTDTITVTITVTDVAETLYIADAEAREDTGTLTFTVSLSSRSDSQITVDYATSDYNPPSARAGTDYTAASGTLTFPPGTTEQPIDVTIIDDVTPERGENFKMTLSNPQNAAITRAVARGTITNDDSPNRVLNNHSGSSQGAERR